MKNFKNLHKRSCYDRRSVNDRRDRWWRFLKKIKVDVNRRMPNERRKKVERRLGWERISKWCSAPFVNPYQSPYRHGLSYYDGYGYPFL